jgi:hypothetical protein
LAAGCAVAQQDQASLSSPFTRQEAEDMSAVWPEIRQAARFEQINWQAAGLRGAPGNAEARRLMATHWDELRRANRFSEIDWESTTGYRESTFARQDRVSPAGPFTRREAEQMNDVWPEIRRAPRFEDIDWEAVGLGVAPGDAEARRLMVTNWDTLRRADRFDDINWEATTASSLSTFAQQRDPATVAGPFTREEAEQMSDVWPQIRQASTFEAINWEATGLGVAPGNAEARRLIATHWDTLRRADRFEDINWEATTGYRNR